MKGLSCDNFPALIATVSAVTLCLLVTHPSERDSYHQPSAATTSSPTGGATGASAVSKGDKPGASVGRIIQASLPADLREMKSGTSWEMALPGGRTVQAQVNLGKADEMFASQWLVGGDLGGVGTFFLSQDKERGALDGWIILYGNPEAWRVVADEAGNPALVSQPVSSIVCLPPGTNVILAPAGAPAGGGAFVTDIPIKSTRPTSPSVLFLDFGGGSITNAAWNDGLTINYSAPCFNRTLIEKVINRVAEFYVPFDVNITTDPTLYSAATPGRRMRCIVAREDIGGGKIEGGIGGVAHTGDYRKAGNGQAPCDAVCWAFANPDAGTPDLTIVQRLGNAIAHELGHTLGLRHWSTSEHTGDPGEYYPAADLDVHGPGSPDNWAPLMGEYNYAQVIQWAKGEYINAENRGLSAKQDDLAVIADSLGAAIAGGTGPGGCVIPSKPGIQAWWPDDKGNTRATAAVLQVNGSAPSDSGLIGATGDEDYFRFTTLFTINQAANPPDHRASWLGHFLWLVDGDEGPDAPIMSPKKGNLDAAYILAHFRNALSTVISTRINLSGNSRQPLRFDTRGGAHRWTAFLREMEPKMPGISGAARNLINSLVFGLGEIDKLAKSFNFTLEEVEAFCQFLVRRAVNARNVILNKAEISRQQALAEKIYRKIEQGCNDRRAIECMKSILREAFAAPLEEPVNFLPEPWFAHYGELLRNKLRSLPAEYEYLMQRMARQLYPVSLRLAQQAGRFPKASGKESEAVALDLCAHALRGLVISIAGLSWHGFGLSSDIAREEAVHVLEHIRKNGPMSRSDVARGNRISKETRDMLLNCFAEADLVKIDGNVVTATNYAVFVEALYARKEFPEPPIHWKTSQAKVTA